MVSDSLALPASRTRLWAGRIMSAIAGLFLFADSIPKIIRLEPVVQGTVELGYPDSLVTTIGIILLLCTILYVIPRTSILGAILLTGYLGGAIATQMRIESPLFSHILFPVYLGILLWGGLFLRDGILHQILPSRQKIKQGK